jgi:hypothetical protein
MSVLCNRQDAKSVKEPVKGYQRHQLPRPGKNVLDSLCDPLPAWQFNFDARQMPYSHSRICITKELIRVSWRSWRFGGLKS